MRRGLSAFARSAGFGATGPQEMTMTRAQWLAKHVDRTVRGPMWHGSALGEVLEGVTHEQAAARPIAGAHSIWEIALHAAAWAEIARARLKGERTGDATTEEDWPPVMSTGADD